MGLPAVRAVAAVSDTPQANIAGSGTLELPNVAAGTMTVNIAGSGTLNASGTAGRLNLNVMGSGSAAMAGLKADSASVNIAGSGDATFSSDGSVDANIVGSGDVTVRGSHNTDTVISAALSPVLVIRTGIADVGASSRLDPASIGDRT